MILTLIKVVLLTMLIGENQSYYNRILDKGDNILYMLPKNAETVADMEWCEGDVPCAIVSKRFWLPHMVTRFCRCKNLPCDTEYSVDKMKPDTIQLDNRSQFKMCNNGDEDITVKRCKYGGSEIGVSVEEVRVASDTVTAATATMTMDSGEQNHLKERRVYISCRCLQGYWQLSRHTLDKLNSTTELHKNHYHCNRLTRCQKGEFCGHIREDTHSAYYRCSCPQGTLCISTDKTLRNASELLYDGPMYRAYCQPIPNSVEDTSQQD